MADTSANESSGAELELLTSRGIARDREIAETVRTAIKWGGVAISAFFVYKAVGVLAGQTTEANILIKVLADFRVSEAVAWILAGSATAVAARTRQLGQKKSKRLGERIKELEERIDPDRSSTLHE